jgi:hypothetical protein
MLGTQRASPDSWLPFVHKVVPYLFPAAVAAVSWQPASLSCVSARLYSWLATLGLSYLKSQQGQSNCITSYFSLRDVIVVLVFPLFASFLQASHTNDKKWQICNAQNRVMEQNNIYHKKLTELEILRKFAWRFPLSLFIWPIKRLILSGCFLAQNGKAEKSSWIYVPEGPGFNASFSLKEFFVLSVA